MTTPQESAWLDQEQTHLAQTIRAHRWAVEYVGAGDQPDEPAFGYTVGLFGLRHPELVVVGLGHPATHGILQRLSGLVVQGRDLVPGELVDVPGRACQVAVEHLPNPGDILFAANRHYDRPDEVSVPAYQLTWAHQDGSFPWEPGYPCDPARCQPRPGTWRA